MYLMNFLFDMSKKKGVFSGDRTEQAPTPAQKPLYTSPNWLELIGTLPATGPFDPDARLWIDLGEMDTATLLISEREPVRDLGIRIAGDPKGPVLDSTKPTTLTLSVCFGRPSHTKQDVASPLVDTAGNVVTTIVQVGMTPTGWNARVPALPPGSDPYWFIPLGKVALFPDKPRRSHRYQFSVGAVIKGTIIAGATEEHHYSHDPEMDVTT